MSFQIQEEIARRRSKKPANTKKAKTNRGRFTSKYALSERLVCGDCGCYFRRVTWKIHGRKQIVWRCINRLEFGPKSCEKSPSLEETALHTAILEAIRSLVHGQQEEMAAALQDALIQCIAGEKEEASPIVIENKIKELETEFDRLLVLTECDKIIFYSLASSYSDSFYGLNTEFIHIAYIVRLILDCCDSNDEIILDFSNLGCWHEDCIPQAISATEDVEKTVVLVEGTSDKDILEFAIQKLYPHLSDLFYFMDFEEANGAKRAGGTSFIIANIKTFYFSRFKSKFIAIFDNDAEGYQSQRALLNEINHWPDNFKILTYPDLPLYRKYPTLAPNGTIMFDNINKKACSIELYLPDSIIKENGEYFPIEWESRKKIKIADKIEEAIYQGVISQKGKIKKKFYVLCKEIEKGENVFFPDEWERMKRLLETIIFAFAKE